VPAQVQILGECLRVDARDMTRFRYGWMEAVSDLLTASL
jgi:hypothetical protein